MNLGGMLGGLGKQLAGMLPLDQVDKGIETLRGAGQNDIADQLAAVRGDLADGTFDPKTTGPVMTNLAGQIEGAAGNLNGEHAERLRGLAGLLKNAGGMMG